MFSFISNISVNILQPCEEIKLDSPRNVTMDRHTFYCVPVPGESDWVKEISFSYISVLYLFE